MQKKNDKDNSLQNKEKIAGVPKLFHTKMLTPHMLQRNWGGTKGFDSQSESWQYTLYTLELQQ